MIYETSSEVTEGRSTHIAPAVQLSRTQPFWERPAIVRKNPLGSPELVITPLDARGLYSSRDHSYYPETFDQAQTPGQHHGA